MSNKDLDNLLDKALEDFEDQKEEPASTEPTIPPSVKETLDKLSEDLGEDMPGFADENLEKMLQDIASQLEGNEELKTELEKIGDELMGDNMLGDSMKELRDKLTQYMSEKGHTLPPTEAQRYNAQLALYNQICTEMDAGNHDRAMELMSQLSQYGDLPSEMVPPMPEDCSIF